MPEPQEGTLYGFQIDDVDGEKVAQDLRPNRLPEVIQGVVFKDEMKQLRAAA